MAILHLQDSSDLGLALSRSGEILKAQDLNVVLRNFGKLNRLKELSQLFNWMEQHGKTNIATYSGYIKFMRKSLSPLQVLDIYNNIRDESAKNNVSVCNAILDCLIKNRKFDSSFKLFEQMKRGGLIPDIVTYSTLLAGCARFKGGYSKAMQLVQELTYNGLQMDGIIYGTLISVCASNHECEEAERYFNQMKCEGHTPNVFHYSSLLNAYSVGGNYIKAEGLIQEMKSIGIVLNKVILTTLLKVYVKGGLYEKSRELLNELEAMGYAEDEMPYCMLMDGYAKAGDVLEAKSVFDEIKKKKVRTDGYCYSIMISAFCRHGHIEDAKLLAYEFEATYSKYDLVLLNSMLIAYCKAGEMEEVMKLMKKMDELTISPDWNTFNILIKYFCKEKLYLLAYRTMGDMHTKGYQPEEGLCSALIYHLGKTGAYSEAFNVYNILRYNKRTMCKALHEKILHILLAGRLLKEAYVVVKDNVALIPRPAINKFAILFMRAGNINLINDVVKVLHVSGFKIDQHVFHMAVSRFIAQPEKKELLLQLLEWMAGHGYVVDSTTRNLVLQHSHFFGRQLTAELLSNQYTMSKT